MCLPMYPHVNNHSHFRGTSFGNHGYTCTQEVYVATYLLAAVGNQTLQQAGVGTGPRHQTAPGPLQQPLKEPWLSHQM